MVETRNMQEGKAGFIAPWELRVSEFRVYYDVQAAPEPLVSIVAVGVKIRERVSIGRKEYSSHEDGGDR
jgi:hypothetical protein